MELNGIGLVVVMEGDKFLQINNLNGKSINLSVD